LLILAEVLLSVVINDPKYTKLLTLSKVICFTLKTFSTYFFLVPQIMYLVLAWLISNPILLAALSNAVVASWRDFGEDLLIISISEYIFKKCKVVATMEVVSVTNKI
jgi:hypothetical protein